MSLSQTRSSKLTMNAKGVVVELFDILISHLKCGWVRIDGPESRWYYFSTFILILQKLKKLKKNVFDRPLVTVIFLSPIKTNNIHFLI